MPDANLYHEFAARGRNILMGEHPLTTQELGKPRSRYVHGTEMHLIHIANVNTVPVIENTKTTAGGGCVGSGEGPQLAASVVIPH